MPSASRTTDPHLLVVRLVSGHPYYRVVDSHDLQPSTSAVEDPLTHPDKENPRELSRPSPVGFLKRLTSLSFIPYASIYGMYTADPIVQLSASQGDGRRLAGVHVSGRISVWSLPGKFGMFLKGIIADKR